MRATARRIVVLGSIACIAFAAFLAICTLIAEYEGREYPPALPVAAVVLAVVGFRHLFWARERLR